ncbi:MAG: sarcosine oxidase subunit alpha family protein [Rhodospirillales bacterium]
MSAAAETQTTTTQPYRLSEGGEIDRGQPLSFLFEGERYGGYAGDTLASALVANGVRLVGRSFKYHRPRGFFAAGAEEPNGLFDITLGARHEPNARATLVDLVEGLIARGVNAEPDLRSDRHALLDRLAAFLPAGFYYKTFMRPTWATWEPRIRRLAGLGRLDPTSETAPQEQRHASCDLLVVGSGPSGLAAASAAVEAGLSVWLVDLDRRAGGQLLWREAEIAGQPAADWISKTLEMLQDRGVTVLTRTLAAAYYDQNRLALLEQRPDPEGGWPSERLWLLRAARVVLASGAQERPLVFPDNDRPGVMSAAAAATYARRYAALPGRRILVATNNDDAYESAFILKQAGAEVTLADLRVSPDQALLSAMDQADIPVVTGHQPVAVEGRLAVEGVRLGRTSTGRLKSDVIERAVDLLCVSGGWSPAVHLFSQSGGKLRYDPQIAGFRPRQAVQDCESVGAADGSFGLQACLAQGHAAGLAAARALGGKTGDSAAPEGREVGAFGGQAIQAFWRSRVAGSRQWIDFQNDVTAKDVALAAREGYVSVEHLKRYTTLGMATDQGKTSNVNGLAILGEETKRKPGEVGTTTFRPPYLPLSLAAIAGPRRGDLLALRRTLPAAAAHDAAGAVSRDYGHWLRPAFYPQAGESEAQAIRREALAVRRQAGLLDGSSLGKIAVVGPDAATFVNRLYYNRLDNLAPGRLRYCLLLKETGVVLDDGVVARLSPERYLLSPSSSHTDQVLHLLDEWHQGEWPDLKVSFLDETQAWATLALCGPRVREVMNSLSTTIAWTDHDLPHMAFAEGQVEGVPARIARVSFTGERGYEISVPARYGQALWERLTALGRKVGLTPFGIEALSLLRAEKGYILIGRDSDGTTLPQDLGMLGPLKNKDLDYVGRRSLFLPEASRPDRRQLVGLEVLDQGGDFANGAHAVQAGAEGLESIGYVTSSFMSPHLDKPIALGLIAGGRAGVAANRKVEVFHLGQRRPARLVAPCFFDPKGARLA